MSSKLYSLYSKNVKKLKKAASDCQNQENIKILKSVNEIFAEYSIPTLEGRMLRGGSDAAYVTQYGIPCIDSLGIKGNWEGIMNSYDAQCIGCSAEGHVSHILSN